MSYLKKHNIWCRGYKEENRFWNGFGIGEPLDGVNANITCEINFPFKGINRRIAGVFAEDVYGNEFVLHRGKIGGGRKGIGKSSFQEKYRGKIITAIDGDRESEFALVGDLNSKNLVQQVCSFIKEVYRIKEEEQHNTTIFSFSEEFFGPKTVKGREESIANCYHGIIVNSLASFLESRGLKIGKDKNRDLFTYKHREIKNIFEIKPDLGNSSLYSAIGQLIIYSIDTSADLFIVMPQGITRAVKKKLETVGIGIIEFEWNGDQPEFYGLEKVKN